MVSPKVNDDDPRASLRSLIAGTGPGEGALEPRARLTSTAPELSLDGLWRFHYASSVDDAPLGVTAVEYDDRTWPETPVPSHWVLHGHGRPVYTNVHFPFPVDPPHVPDENGIGDYRRSFEVPAEFGGGGRVVLRLDGAESAASIWLNGSFVGSTYGSRLAHEFDVTDLVRSDRNVLAIRVAQWSAASYLEDQDMWWLPGLFRSVTLLSRPAGGIDDLTVVADFDHRTGEGRLRVAARVDGDAATLSCPELGLHELALPLDLSLPVEPWSAEVPRLYELTISTASETVVHPIGFRTIVVEDSRILVNGVDVLFRGMNRHEHNPDTGRVMTEQDHVHDLHLMKRHNINAIRTAHYPPDHRLLALADRLGFYVVDECDFESHGFVDVQFRNNPTDDAAWRPALLDRMARTVMRDRNHASVVMWSLGNESGTGANLEHMSRLTRSLDPTRPIHYERSYESEHVDVYSRMYLSHEELDEIGRFAEPPLEDPVLDARRRAMPFLLCEYAHSMGNAPGGLSEYQALFEKYPRLQGGFIWEWKEHGLRQRTSDGREFFAYGGDFGEPLHDGNFVADGMVSPDGVPRPGLLDYKKVIEPIRMAIADDWATVHLVNRFDFRSTETLAFIWELRGEDGTIDSGTFDGGAIPPHREGVLDLPASVRAHRGEAGPAVLTISAREPSALEWAEAGHEIAWAQAEVTAAVPSLTGVVAPHADGHVLRVGPAEFSARDGALRSIGGVVCHGEGLNLWRAPTDNDLGVRMLEFGGRTPDVAAWNSHFLDRLQTRTLSVELQDHALVVRTRTAPPALDCAVLTEYRWTSDGTSVVLDVEATPTGEWGALWARIGFDFRLDERTDRVRWYGKGPGQAYPDTGQHARLGWFDAPVDGLGVDYLRPQENGARGDVRRLDLHGQGGLAISGRTFAFTLKRWTDQAIDAAAHPTDLEPDGGVHLTLDAAQHGIGTGACGPGVLPQYRLTPRPASLQLTFTPLAASAG